MTQAPSNPIPQQVLSEDQQSAFDHVLQWLEAQVKAKAENKPMPQPQLTLGGFAGTGKTTLIKRIIQACPKLTCNVMALTGKAVSVLNKKGLTAATIHATIYSVDVVDKKPVFYLRSRLWVDFLIVDEASMVSTELYNDLLTFKIPILWVGDHGQLEPVGDNPQLMITPVIRLEKIHRQAEGNPIIKFSHMVREGHKPVLGKEPVQTVSKKEIELNDLLTANQIIVAYNKTRIKINSYVRQQLGYDSRVPVPGDKVICLKNKRQQGIFNGLQGVIKDIRTDVGIGHTYMATITLDDGREYTGPILGEQFGMEKGLVETSDKEASHWDYAYAVTCHKSQGSEWPFVIVIEEFCKWWSMNRWRYTAVTRASERLLYALP